jgi:membrane protein YqaA with SNARE-associated domain
VPFLSVLLKPRRVSGPRYLTFLRHLGAFGLFALAIADSSPIPTFAGADILTVILSASHRNPWYEYASVATAGSVIGAYLTFRIARGAGADYLERKFGKKRMGGLLKTFEKWGTPGLVLSTAVPLPLPTGAFFAAAGVLDYPARSFLAVVTISRALRFTGVALLAWYYGPRLIRVFRHPGQYALWLVAIAIAVLIMAFAGMKLRKMIESD